jgi:molecular chaperone IbpA
MARINLDSFFVGWDNIINSPLASTALPAYPRYNIEKVENGYQIQVAVPGWNREQIKVSLHNCILTIAGERKEETEGRNWIHKGISGKSFERSLKLDDTLTVSSASMEDGMLYVNLVYVERDASKFIKIT